jgi:hypothetical protein
VLQGELEAQGINARIFGVNGIGYEAGNATVTTGRTAPWLQPTDPATDPWTAWGVAYRDVVILDEQNFPVATYNLTVNDLSNPANFDALEALIVQYATD